MPVKFPVKFDDGSFCIKVVLQVDTQRSLRNEIQTWLDQWVQENRYWAFSTPSSKGNLDFYESFSAAPRCIEEQSGVLSLQFEGRPGASKDWKDWLVLRILKELQETFKGVITIGEIKNCLADAKE
jgi:hypothetical protein